MICSVKMNSKKRRMRCDNDKYRFQKKKNEEYIQFKEKSELKEGRIKLKGSQVIYSGEINTSDVVRVCVDRCRREDD